MAKKVVKACDMPSCEYENTTQGAFCVNCRASIGRWAKREIADIQERRRKLHLYTSRMLELGSKPRRKS